MPVIHAILLIIYVIFGVTISVVALMQRGRSSGLGSAIGGIPANSYWSKSRGRPMEGVLEHSIRYGAIASMLTTTVLNVTLEVMR